MPGKRQLGRDGEDPVAVVGALGGGRLDKGGLGQPRLARHAQHGLVVETVGVVYHRERVALQRRGGEDVENGVGPAQRSKSKSRGGFCSNHRRSCSGVSCRKSGVSSSRSSPSSPAGGAGSTGRSSSGGGAGSAAASASGA